VAAKADALEALSEWVDDINVANDLHNIDGFLPVVSS